MLRIIIITLDVIFFLFKSLDLIGRQEIGVEREPSDLAEWTVNDEWRRSVLLLGFYIYTGTTKPKWLRKSLLPLTQSDAGDYQITRFSSLGFLSARRMGP